MADDKQRLSRLDPEYYRGHAWVHWTMTLENRRTGWLGARSLYKFRELLTHTTFRYQLACPIYCLMPDHLHLLWCGLSESASDQRTAVKAFRKDFNQCLRKIGFELQRQPFDHVLRDVESQPQAVEELAEYIARNPERQQLVVADGFADYPYTGCLLPGFPNVQLFIQDGWDDVWRILAFLKRTECFRKADPKRET